MTSMTVAGAFRYEWVAHVECLQPHMNEATHDMNYLSIPPGNGSQHMLGLARLAMPACLLTACLSVRLSVCLSVPRPPCVSGLM